MFPDFFNDKHGKMVIFQSPNLPILLWAVAAFANLFFRSSLLGWVATVALAIWALLELLRGASRFRQLLGLIVLLYIVASRLILR